MYAVIDVETTGLRPSWHDRIAEIAIVHVDGSGRVESEWCSLVNPERDMGPQHIHGISAAEARTAPTFEQLSGTLAALLAGRVIVAHNLRFDGAFLAYEFSRLDARAPISTGSGLCTMQLATRFLPGAGRSLADCCDFAEIVLDNAHSALSDARAAAALLAVYLRAAGAPPPWAALLAQAARAPWPPFPAHEAQRVQRRHPRAPLEHFLGRLVGRLPRASEPDADEYLALLDRVLLDRHISVTEADALVELAQELGIDRDGALDLHQRYLAALAATALEDGVITEEEHRDLVTVTRLLGLTKEHLNSALAAQAKVPSQRAGGSSSLGHFTLAAGDTVVFTGQMDRPREDYEQLARDHGLSIGGTVTRLTRLVVAADPDSMSGKARKASAYGIPIIDPATFARFATKLDVEGVR